MHGYGFHHLCRHTFRIDSLYCEALIGPDRQVDVCVQRSAADVKDLFGVNPDLHLRDRVDA